MNSMLLAGYYGMDNSGDDALLAVSNWGVKTYFNSDRIYATAKFIPRFSGSESIIPIFTPVTRFRGENRLRGYIYPTISRQIIFGGGSVFHSSPDLRAKLNMLKLSGKGPHAALGVSIGPFRDSCAEKTCAEVLKRLSFIGLRDQESLEIARAICPDVRAEKTFDLAPLLPRSAGLSIESFDSNKERRGLGFALCNHDRYITGDDKPDTCRKNNIIQMLNNMSSDDLKDIEEIVLIDFNGNSDSGDHQLHADIAKSLGTRFSIRHLKYSSDPVKVLRTISGLRAIVAMRLHAAVFAYLTHTPAIILSYHPKCIGWASEIGLSKELLFDSNNFNRDQLTRIILETMSGRVDRPTLNPSVAESLSLKNWEWVNEQN